ncbi:MAG: hypothetical protein AAB910_01285 [Patescibacteria group bacterium]
MAEQSSEALQSQIAELERQLAAQRVEKGVDTSAPYKRAEVHAAVGEQIKQVMPSYQAPVSATPPDASTPSWQDPALAGPVQELVNVAFTQGLQQAVDQASKSGNPALIDALHDVLVDQLHQELLNRQQLRPAP